MITSASGQRSSGPNDRSSLVADAIVQLLRLAVDDEWSEDAAAPKLRERVPDESLLWLARANLSKIMVESSGWVIDRAATIIESALRQGQPAGPEVDPVACGGWNHDRLRPRCHPNL